MGQQQSATLYSVYNKHKLNNKRKLRIDDKFFKILCKTGPNCLYNGNTMLLLIIMDYKLLITENIELKLQLIESLLLAGADTNIKWSSNDDNNGKNALMLIADCKYGSIDKIRLLFILIEYGAINKLDSLMIYPTLYSLSSFLEVPMFALFQDEIFDKFMEICYNDEKLMNALMNHDIKTIKQITKS